MKHVAVITSGLVGITNASLKLVQKLKAERYKVTYLCPIDIKEKIEKHKIDYIQLPEINFSFSFLNMRSNKQFYKVLKAYLYHFTHLKSQ